MDRTSIISNVLPTVFMVESVPASDRTPVVAENIIGTAFVLDEPDGWLVTAKHVLGERDARDLRCRSVYSRGPQPRYALGLIQTVAGVIRHPTRDLAVMRMHRDATKGRGVRFLDRQLALGESVLLAGFARGTDYIYCDELLGPGSPKSPTPVWVHGMVGGLVPHDGRRPELYVSDVTTCPGNSGGPLVHAGCDVRSRVLGTEGAVAAVHVGGAARGGYGYSVPIEYAIAFLQEVRASGAP